jgi:hypothetical protein
MAYFISRRKKVPTRSAMMIAFLISSIGERPERYPLYSNAGKARARWRVSVPEPFQYNPDT